MGREEKSSLLATSDSAGYINRKSFPPLYSSFFT